MKMPAVISQFFEATKNYDKDALFATFSKDIKLKDEGKFVPVEQLSEWNDDVYFGVQITLEPLSIRAEDGQTVVDVILNGDYSKFGLSGPFNYQIYFKINEGLITYLDFKEKE